MSSHDIMNPYGGVHMGRIVEPFDPNARPTIGSRIKGFYLSKSCGFTFTTRLRPGNLCEPPGADPHAGWCGGRGRKTPGYPIGSTPRIACIYLRYLPLPPISRHPRLNDASPAEKIQKQIPNTLGRKRLSSTMTCRRTSRSAAKSYSFVSNHLYMTKAST